MAMREPSTRESESDFSDDDELDPKYSKFFTAEDNQTIKTTLDEIGAPSADASSSSSSEASGDSTAVANEDGDGEIEIDQENLFRVIQSFTVKKQLDRQKAERLRVRRPKLSSKTLRRMDAKAKAFLMKTIDDQHVLMIKEKKTPYEIFTTLCAMYEDTAIHRDPYYIMNYLMALYVMTDKQKTIYLYHAFPDVWKVEMADWKGSRKYVPYEELKRHIETKVRNEMERSRYTLKQGTPESRETQAENALQAEAPAKVEFPPKKATALVTAHKCSYCGRDNHDTVDCYILQRHIQSGQVKEGIILPAKFKLKSLQGTQLQHSYKEDYKNRGGDRQPRSHHNNGRGNDNHNENDRRHNNRGRPDRHGHQSFDKFHGRRNQKGNGSDRSDYGIIAITTLDLTLMKNKIRLTAQDGPHDPAWTIDSGCTRHIPILGTGTVNMTVTDTKGSKRIISLSDVLYAPELKFNCSRDQAAHVANTGSG
uniref:Uncharacterized protein n=1 Tax=Phytophthora ramorum TaxID=164328 RepID=H3GZS9_PHYRM